MLVKFCPLMFDCSCMKPSETFPDECLFTRLDPPVKYRTRGIWRGGFVSWSANKRRSAAPVITFGSPTCPHSLCSYQHTRTQLRRHTAVTHTRLSPEHILPFRCFFFPMSKFNTHPHPCTHRHTQTHTIPVVSLLGSGEGTWSWASRALPTAGLGHRPLEDAQVL